jgi:hypothetical protein
LDIYMVSIFFSSFFFLLFWFFFLKGGGLLGIELRSLIYNLRYTPRPFAF